MLVYQRVVTMIESTNIGIVLRNTMCWQGEVESDFWGVDMWKKTASKTRSLRTSPGPDRDRCGQITHLVGGLEHVFSIIYGIILPNWLIVFKMIETTNQTNCRPFLRRKSHVHIHVYLSFSGGEWSLAHRWGVSKCEGCKFWPLASYAGSELPNA